MTSDACREMRAALGAVALGGADPAEELALLAHLDGCAECRAELRELASVAAALPLVDPANIARGLPQPAPALAQRVLGRVAAERTTRRTRVRRRFAGAAAGVVAIAAAVLAFVLLVPGGSSPSGTRVVFASKSGVSAAATLRPSESGTEVAFHVSGLHDGDYYWLWLTGDDGDRIAAGTFRGTAGPADLVMNVGLPLSEARRIWVTDEHDRIVLDQLLPAPGVVCGSMPQNVPAFEFSDNAEQVRARIFEFWCEHGRGPTLLEMHQATGLDRRHIIAAYKELQLGIDIVVNEDTQNCNLLKAPPFSSFPSQVRAYIDDEFHSFVGCASEAIAFSHMPPFKDKTVRLESHCACCFTPVTLVSKNFEMQSVTPPGIFLHISLSPYDWNNVDMSRMCDSMNYVLDAEHAERYERQTATRGILVDLDQAKMFVQNVANERMYNFHWKPGTLNPRAVIKGFRMMGVDTSAWE